MIHIAILLKPYLDLILAGEKTVECRLTQQARPPYGAIEPGERIYFKQSAGPYGATAVVEHVLFEEGLTPARIEQIKRDYNDLIRGEDDYWAWKRTSRYCTLIWLTAIEPTDSGPAVPPLRGMAWKTLDDEPAWRRCDGHAAAMPAQPPLLDAHADRGTFSITITPGNLRNGTLYVTRVLDRFPSETFGGATRDAAAVPLTLMLHSGPTVQTDIVGPRKFLRTRVWRRWFAEHDARPGDRVVFTPIDHLTYLVGLVAAGPDRPASRPAKSRAPRPPRPNRRRQRQ